VSGRICVDHDKEMLMPPRVTLAMPVYNGERFVAEAICSVLAQDYADFELIITDNASTDKTEMICREFATADPRIKYIRNERNLGAGPNHNKGFELASGEFFKWCSCDDYMSSDYVGACVRALDADPGAVLAYGVTTNVDEEGRSIFLPGETMMPEMTDALPARRFHKAMTTLWTVDQETYGLFRSSALMKTDLQASYSGSDHNLLREVALLGRFTFVPDIVFYNREHSERSAKIVDKKGKRLWQDTATVHKPAVDSYWYFAHLIKITLRHRRLASPVKTLPSVLMLALSPRSLAHTAIDVIGVVSPSAEDWLRMSCRSVLHRLRPPLAGAEAASSGGPVPQGAGVERLKNTLAGAGFDLHVKSSGE
jgi:glycosyltransferase involved in cell wall biosynthesis